MEAIQVVVGSRSDMKVVDRCLQKLDELGIKYDSRILSVHKDLDELLNFLDEVDSDFSVKVIIAAAGMAAALPGICASRTNVPVIGLPLANGPGQGIDALLSMAQLPKGVPVAVVGIDAAENAAEFASNIIYIVKEELEDARMRMKELEKGAKECQD